MQAKKGKKIKKGIAGQTIPFQLKFSKGDSI
jgi:hypothetical protein